MGNHHRSSSPRRATKWWQPPKWHQVRLVVLLLIPAQMAAFQNCEQINGCCFKPLSFGLVCYSALNTCYTSSTRLRMPLTSFSKLISYCSLPWLFYCSSTGLVLFLEYSKVFSSSRPLLPLAIAWQVHLHLSVCIKIPFFRLNSNTMEQSPMTTPLCKVASARHSHVRISFLTTV